MYHGAYLLGVMENDLIDISEKKLIELNRESIMAARFNLPIKKIKIPYLDIW